MEIHNDRSHGGVYHHINDFMGAHVECVFRDFYRVQYELAFLPEGDLCLVTLRCECGVTTSLNVSGAVGHAIADMNRLLHIPTTQRNTDCEMSTA